MTTETKIYYPYKALKLNKPETWFGLAVFFFAVPFLVFENRVSKPWSSALFRLIELLVGGWVASTVFLSVTLFYDPLTAGYVAITAISSYFIIAFIQFLTVLIAIYKSRRTMSAN